MWEHEYRVHFTKNVWVGIISSTCCGSADCSTVIVWRLFYHGCLKICLSCEAEILVLSRWSSTTPWGRCHLQEGELDVEGSLHGLLGCSNSLCQIFFLREHIKNMLNVPSQGYQISRDENIGSSDIGHCRCTDLWQAFSVGCTLQRMVT